MNQSGPLEELTESQLLKKGVQGMPNGLTIEYQIYLDWKDQPILHDEDYWDGQYKTYGQMWMSEGYAIAGYKACERKGIDIAKSLNLQ